MQARRLLTKNMGYDTAHARPVVLVVDDNADAADSMVMLLEGSGFAASAAYGGHEALQLVQELAPDVVLSDIEMPGMDGLQEVVAIRSLPLKKQPWMIAISGAAKVGLAMDAFAAGFDHFMPKPAELSELFRVLHGFGRGRRYPGHAG